MEKNELHASKAGECKSCIVVLKISRCSLNISRLKNYCWLGMGFPDLSADEYDLGPSHICCDVLCFSSHLLLWLEIYIIYLSTVKGPDILANK